MGSAAAGVNRRQDRNNRRKPAFADIAGNQGLDLW